MFSVKSVYTLLLIAAGLSLAGFLLLLTLKINSGLLLILFFVFLALGIRAFTHLKSIAYTLWIFAAVSAAFFYPSRFIQLGNFELKLAIIPLLQIIMFGMGSQMSLLDFLGVIKTPKAVFIGIICQFSIMPVIALLITTVMQFPPEIAAGIILVGASPSGLASNVMSFLARANIALSVTLTAVATILSPILTPLLMNTLAGELIPVDFWKMMIGIMDMVILPIVGGLLFNAFAYGVTEKKNKLIQILVYALIILGKNLMVLNFTDSSLQIALQQFLNNLIWFLVIPILGGIFFLKMTGGNRHIMDRALALISMVGIAIIIAIITANGRESLIEIGFLLILACLLHNLLGYSLGYWVCRLLRMDEKSCRTIALEVGMQNGGLASGIALQMGKVATVGLAPSVFGPLMNITGSTLATWWRGKKII